MYIYKIFSDGDFSFVAIFVNLWLKIDFSNNCRESPIPSLLSLLLELLGNRAEQLLRPINLEVCVLTYVHTSFIGLLEISKHFHSRKIHAKLYQQKNNHMG